MRDKILIAARQHFRSHIEKHKMNIEIMLSNPMAIHDHTDFMTALEDEVSKVAEYRDKLEVLEDYFME